MLREELDFIGSMNMCDEISNEAYKKIVCHCREQEPCPNAISHSDMLDAIGHGTTYTSEDLQGIIKGLPSVNPQPCEDAISRQAAIRIAERGQVQGYEWQFKELNKLPPVNPQPKTGHWIRQTDDYHDYYECEHCGIAVGLDDIKNYCPNCGCRMVDPQESEE